MAIKILNSQLSISLRFYLIRAWQCMNIIAREVFKSAICLNLLKITLENLKSYR